MSRSTLDLIHWIDQWQSCSVLVLGDAILDRYMNGSSDRLCRDAPAPVINIYQCQDLPGGAANTAANIASLGGKVALLSVIGRDPEGESLRIALEQRGVSTEHVLQSDRATLAKQRVVAGSQILVRLDQGTATDLPPDLEQQVIDRLINQYSRYDAIIVSDYSAGILSDRIISTLSELQSQHRCKLVIDSRRLEKYRSLKPTVVKPNYDEATALLNLPKQIQSRVDQIVPHRQALSEQTGASIVAVTLDTEGAIVFESNHPAIRTATRPAPSNQTSGAGDTYISAFTLALAANASTEDAATLAATATNLVVQQPGTTSCNVEGLRQALIDDAQFNKIIIDQSDLATSIRSYRLAGQRIVFTNGCFDILHPGHVAYLTQAKALGDVLIVGVNTDESIQRLKGKNRPVNPLCDRLTVLAALHCIDHVVPFAEPTPHNLIQIICPNVYVKGGDYRRETLPEANLVEELGGIVKILPYVENRSTTRLIHQIRALQL
ncbi:MAG: D-glycero-beta-D-manno-heptose 1-phosphate adenylyltransferase [Leptolyngbya sp. Prado105]|jgi:D-beta-D-heptose 7-phosphate kinase/D-beta-D-heptose 1-phosphate adenosyltransferase|nr:D-glycero-beta-D-manno-heptose 1-phosphate adenylyltransferase [Leptolyngbya sp. Prado105]